MSSEKIQTKKNITLERYTWNGRETYEASPTWEQVKPSYLELATEMGYPGELPEEVLWPAEQAMGKVSDKASPHLGFTIIEGGVVPGAKTVEAGNVVFNTMPIISKQLRKAEALVLFAVTAGSVFEELSRQWNAEGDYLLSFVVDAIGSATAESIADLAEELIDEALAVRYGGSTHRYSPGYCNWVVSEQQKLFTFFPDGFCGITLTPSSLMQPIKSVSGIIALGANCKKEAYACQICDDEKCYQKRRVIT